MISIISEENKSFFEKVGTGLKTAFPDMTKSMETNPWTTALAGTATGVGALALRNKIKEMRARGSM
jgi:hypothetical protein